MRKEYHLIQTLANMLNSATIYLERHVELVNNMNVFPVPDGDTGTNMFNTLRGIKNKVGTESSITSLSQYLNCIAQAGLYEGRGNSGIILSQIFQGFALEFDKHQSLTLESFASCLKKAKDSAYNSVGAPVEGTILTVMSDLSEVAFNNIQNGDVCESFRKLAAAAGTSVDDTPDLLDKLREAEVVDSGGYGLEIIITGMIIELDGGDPSTFPLIARVPGGDGLGVRKVIEHNQAYKEEYGLCIQFILNSTYGSSEIKNKLETVASSTVVVGNGLIFKIHTHGENYDEIIETSEHMGVISDIYTDNMDEQALGVLTNTSAKQINPIKRLDLTTKCALVTVSSGQGITDLFYELGATVVIDGGDSMNPSVSEFLSVIETIDAEILILPNNKNIISTAHQASNLSGNPSAVLDTETVQQGLECVFDFNPDSTVLENIAVLEDIRAAVSSFSIFESNRTTTVNGKQVTKGQIIGMADGRITHFGENPEIVLYRILNDISSQESERIVVLVGNFLPSTELNSLIRKINLEFASLKDKLDVIHGGQPHYDYLISVIGSPN